MMARPSFLHIQSRDPEAPLVLLCEHASNVVPPPLQTSAQDHPWLQTHWAWDIGVATVIKTVAEQLGCSAVMANFSRLVCDPNRPVSDDTFIRYELEGHALSFNQHINSDEVQRRVETYYEPYHQAVERMIQTRLKMNANFLVFSIHSFTPNYLGQQREVEVGVLYDDYEKEAHQMRDGFKAHGFDVRLNEPWSGVDGMMFSPHKHGTQHNLVNLELEVRQDLIGNDNQAHGFGLILAKILKDLCRWRFANQS
ncbi:MAG: hypothetical protein CMH56_08220 [Myxococcales bacterium]|nr:hypothetical protein [Myxococcales bacterium]|tara:strand:+ start:1887 stop:2645 length:759 start_codon:yes stop_codon:yes gene_type:complete